MRSVGIDVGVRKGLDLVALDRYRTVLETASAVRVDRLARLVVRLEPDVVAIDSPPGWALNGRSRVSERELRRFGIRCFATPSDRRMAGHRFYEWMTVGFAAFRVIEAWFPRYRSGSVTGTAIEVFPHVFALEERFVALGDPAEGQVLVPATAFVRGDDPALAPLAQVAG